MGSTKMLKVFTLVIIIFIMIVENSNADGKISTFKVN